MKIEENFIAVRLRYARLLKANYENNEADLISKLLLEHICSKKMLELISLDYCLSDLEIANGETLITRILNSEPTQYVLGKWIFNNLEFIVNKDVLIPRPETEELIQLIGKTEQKKENLKLIDIGTGSGCIAISLKNKFPMWDVSAVDVCEKALEVARQNASINSCSIRFEIMDILNFPNDKIDYFDIIVSNPPYILLNEKADMTETVLMHEPHKALFVSDNDPLQYYRAIIRYCEYALKTNGRLYFETHYLYNDAVVDLLTAFNYTAIGFFDLSGKKRMVMATK